MATLGMRAEDRAAIEAFRRDVIDPSMTSLVILDFWAEWCGPCKQLGPVLEKVAADYAAKGVRLHKVDVDQEKMIASQFQVRSIPTVYAVFQGQLVADLTPARTEAQLARALDEILAQLPVAPVADEAEPAPDVAPLIAMGEEVLAAGDASRAVSIFSQLTELAPDDPAVIGGHLRALAADGRGEEAATLLAAVPDDRAADPAIQRAASTLALARDARPVDDLDTIRRRIESDPDDHGARIELSGALLAVGDRDGAADALLASIARDRDWGEGAARQRLLTMMEAIGIEDPWVSATRRRLSAILFG